MTWHRGAGQLACASRQRAGVRRGRPRAWSGAWPPGWRGARDGPGSGWARRRCRLVPSWASRSGRLVMAVSCRSEVGAACVTVWGAAGGLPVFVEAVSRGGLTVVFRWDVARSACGRRSGRGGGACSAAVHALGRRSAGTPQLVLCGGCSAEFHRRGAFGSQRCRRWRFHRMLRSPCRVSMVGTVVGDRVRSQLRPVRKPSSGGVAPRVSSLSLGLSGTGRVARPRLLEAAAVARVLRRSGSRVRPGVPAVRAPSQEFGYRVLLVPCPGHRSVVTCASQWWASPTGRSPGFPG